MWSEIRRHPKALAISIGLHILFITLLVIGFRMMPRDVGNPNQRVIQAETVTPQALKAMQQPSPAEQQREAEAKRKAEAAALAAKRQAEEQAKQQAALEAQRKAEAAAKQQAALEAKRQAEEKAKQQAALEAKRKAEAVAKQQAALEAKRKAEAVAKQKAALEAKRKAEAEAKRKAEAEARQKAALAAELKQAQQQAQQALQAEQAAAAAKARQVQENAYVNAIKARIQQAWLRPPDEPPGQTAEIHVTQTPGGFVTKVTLVRCSGSPAFCRSVEAAVWKAEPLPQPKDPALFQRDLTFFFEPDQS
ncbi:MAG: cell envelope integrity protein TolA [Gammaproteobacteria bacterium]|jgi:colicin import membrane protein